MRLRQPLALGEPLHGLARTPARRHDAVVLVQHDHHLAALLDEHTAPFGLDAEVLPARCRIHHPFTLS